MKRLGPWYSQWVFYVTAALLLSAVVLRSILLYDGFILFESLAIQAVWALLFLFGEMILPKRSPLLWGYLTLQTLLVVALLFLPGFPDSFAALFFVLNVQVVQRAGSRAAAICIGLFILLLILPTTGIYGVSMGMASVLIYAAGMIIFAIYALAAAGARTARANNVRLAGELQEKNDQLKQYASQLERLAALQERQHLARDLHDSATQTVFSMTLTTQSALLLLDRDPARSECTLRDARVGL